MIMVVGVEADRRNSLAVTMCIHAIADKKNITDNNNNNPQNLLLNYESPVLSLAPQRNYSSGITASVPTTNQEL